VSLSSRAVPVADMAVSREILPLTYCTRFSAKYKVRIGANTCGNKGNLMAL
jgi:hypothetical protein